MYALCGLQQDVDKTNMCEICSLFEESEDIAQRIEFLADLSDYYKRGYGVKDSQDDDALPAQVSCLLLDDLLKTSSDAMLGDMAKSIENKMDSKTKVIAASETAHLRFTHSESILSLSALLGLNNDRKPYTAALWRSGLTRVRWQPRKIAPMAANIQMVLYRCKNRVKPWPPIPGEIQDDVYKVELLV